MKLAICSDLHLEFSKELPNLITDAEVLIIAGDLCEARKLKNYTVLLDQINNHYKAVLYVMGNHEFYGSEYVKAKSIVRALLAEYQNVHLLDNSTLEIDGITFGGSTLWGYIPTFEEWFVSQGMNDYKLIKLKTDTGYRRLRPRDTTLQHSIAREWILKQKVDVMITHHAPSLMSVSDKFRDNPYNCCYASDLDDRFFEGKQLWVHGHMHDPVDYVVNTCNVVSNPRGYYGHEQSACLFELRTIKLKKPLA